MTAEENGDRMIPCVKCGETKPGLFCDSCGLPICDGCMPTGHPCTEERWLITGEVADGDAHFVIGLHGAVETHPGKGYVWIHRPDPGGDHTCHALAGQSCTAERFELDMPVETWAQRKDLYIRYIEDGERVR